jgi:predicted amidophosphoribosyltransferase
LRNIKNSFKLKKPEKIKGKNIIIFDDIITTGSTMREAAKVLKKAGAKKIYFLTIAH